MEKICNKINVMFGAVTVAMSAALGKYWWLFLSFLILNAVDYITGILKAKYFHVENSCKGLTGIIKKVGYWIIIALAFYVSVAFRAIGDVVSLNLDFVILFGWFTLATFIINEIRSIIENLVVMGVEVPEWLVYGMEAAQKAVKDKADNIVSSDEKTQTEDDVDGD